MLLFYKQKTNTAIAFKQKILNNSRISRNMISSFVTIVVSGDNHSILHFLLHRSLMFFFFRFFFFQFYFYCKMLIQITIYKMLSIVIYIAQPRLLNFGTFYKELLTVQKYCDLYKSNTV